MKRLSRLTALLLALVLVLSMSVGAWAEEATNFHDYNEDAYAALYKSIMACQSYEEYVALVSGISEEDFGAFLASLSEEQLAELNILSETLVPLIPVGPTVSNYDAGPFMPPVNVAVRSRARLMTLSVDDEQPENGLFLDKTATIQEDGSYKIRLEAYTTGSVTNSAVSKPVDIVLVLDQSGSMMYGFDGSQYAKYADSRQKALKTSVRDFIDKVYEKYSEQSDHRIAIVTFSDTATLNSGWTFVDSQGASTLKRIIGDPNRQNSGLGTADGGTQADDGMSLAKNTIIGTGYNYTGSNTDRQKVVVFFTDGVPGNYGYTTTVADDAIAAAKDMKDAGVTVYSVGIFEGAHPSQLYGTKQYNKSWNGWWQDSGTVCTGDVNDWWGYYSDDVLNYYDYTAVAGTYTPAANRFMNYISSNYSTAQDDGLTYINTRGGFFESVDGYFTIQKNYNRTAAAGENYFLTASDATGLSKIFEVISNQISTETIDLGTQTEVRDIVTPYFDVPENTSSISVYTANYNGTAFVNEKPVETAFENEEVFAGAGISLNDQTISVSGFDFKDNCVTDKTKTEGESDFGKKLIIEFTVTPTEDFLGGNGVPTNAETSAVYDKDGTKVEEFPVPTVDVPVKTVSPVVQDQNIYLTNPADLTQLVNRMGSFTVGEGTDAKDYTVNGTNNHFVDITYTIKDGNTVIATYTIPAGTSDLTGISWVTAEGESTVPQLVDDKQYTIDCTVAPTNTGTVSDVSASGLANVYVFMPVITFRDSVEDYLSTHTFPDYYENVNEGNNLVSVVWKHNSDIAGTEEGQVLVSGDVPVLVRSYTVSDDDIASIPVNGTTTGQIVATEDIPVNVAVSVNKPDPSDPDSTSWDITGYTTFAHSACEFVGCTWNESWNQHNGNANKDDTSSESIPEFLIHVTNIVADLTITKTGLNKNVYLDYDDDESAIVTVRCTDSNIDDRVWTVVLTKNEQNIWTATLSGLKVGATYTVTEQTGWTWRYTSTNPTNTVTIVKEGSSVTIENTQTNPYWLGGDNYCVNEFASGQATAE